MKLKVSSSGLADLPKGSEAQIARAVTRGMRAAALGMKEDLRDEVVSAGLGRRLANAWRGDTFPRSGDSMEAAAYVHTKAPKLIDAFDRGVTIRSKHGFYLAIPTEFAGSNRRGGKITPGEWEKRTGLRLRYVYRRGRPSLLVAELRSRTGKSAANPGTRFAAPSARTRSGLATVVVFVLVPQAKLRKRLDIGTTARRWADRVPGLVAANWD